MFAKGMLASLLFSSVAEACTVPVFRYALDRWPADAYRFEVPAGWMDDEQSAKLRALLSETETELEIVTLDEGSAAARLLMPTEAETVIWSGQPDATVTSLFVSPAREQIAQNLFSGESMVWVMVSSGDAEKDRAFEKRLTARLKYLESVAAIPEQDPNDPESKIGPGPNLRAGFSFLKVARDDGKEQPFLKMLAGPDGASLLIADEPFAGVVFGRGRALGAWLASDLDDEGIDEVSLFLLGACSCRVKFQNPGWDIAMAIDWDTRLMAAQMAADRELEEGAAPEVSEVVAKAAPVALIPEVVSFGGDLETESVSWSGEVKSRAGIVVGIVAVFAGLVALYFVATMKRS